MLLELEIRVVPVLERDADAAHDQVGAAAHPGRPFLAHPDDLLEREWVGAGHAGDPLPRALGDRVLGAVLEAHQVARRVLGGVVRAEIRSEPSAGARRRLGQPRELADGVEGNLRIVGAGLHREVAAAARLLELVAVELRQVDKRRGPPRGQAVTVLTVLDEQPGAETESQGQSRGTQPNGLAAIRRRRRRRFTLSSGARGVAARPAAPRPPSSARSSLSTSRAASP